MRQGTRFFSWPRCCCCCCCCCCCFFVFSVFHGHVSNVFVGRTSFSSASLGTNFVKVSGISCAQNVDKALQIASCKGLRPLKPLVAFFLGGVQFFPRPRCVFAVPPFGGGVLLRSDDALIFVDQILLFRKMSRKQTLSLEKRANTCKIQ